MTGGAFLGRGLVEQDSLAFHHPRQLVAAFTANVAMHSFQWKGRPFVVVEKRRLPFGGVVAFRASCSSCLGELITMNFLMAVLAFCRRRLKVHVRKPGFHVGRFVAVDAGRCPMSADQRKCGFGVIEPRQLVP